MFSKQDDKNLKISQAHHKKKGEEKFDKNLKISHIHHKKKGEEKFDKNLKISHIHHKKKGEEKSDIKTCPNGYIKTIERVLCIALAILITGMVTITISVGIEEESFQDSTESSMIYYVAKTGNDNNPGTETLPWLTIGKAANTVTAGSTVYIKSGTYKEKLIPKNSGSAGNYITFAAYPGHNVTIDGTGIAIPNWNGLVLVSGKSYINITGLRVINSRWAGFLVTSSSHINIKKNYVYNTISSGILMSYGNNYVADGNEIVKGSNGDSSMQEIISIQGNVNIFDIKNNYVHDGGSVHIGIDAKNGASNGKIHHNRVYDVASTGIYIDAWDKTQGNIEVYSNIVSKTGTGIGISGEIGGTVNNISIHNNLIYDVLGMGIRIPTASNAGNARLNNIKVFNNVIYRNGYNNPWRTGGIYIGQWPSTYINNLTVRNNIVGQNDYYQIKHVPNTKHSNIVIDNNLIDGYRGTAYEVKGTNYVEGNPLFIDAALKNFRLKSTSPAIDKGSSSGAPSIDFDGITRPKGVSHDIGSFEYIGNTTSKITVTSPNGGENWRRGTIHTISWTKTGSPGSYVKIELLKGVTLNRVISSSTPNDGSYSWTISSNQTLGVDYKVRITSANNSVYKDMSDNNFIIGS